MYWVGVGVLWWIYLVWTQGYDRREAMETVEAWHNASVNGVEGALEALGAAIEALKHII